MQQSLKSKNPWFIGVVRYASFATHKMAPIYAPFTAQFEIINSTCV